MICITADAFDPAREIADFETSMAGAGAIVTFLGSVRRDGAHHNDQITGLYLQHFPDLTERSVIAIVDQARAQWDLQGIFVRHRYGMMAPGDAIVLVCAASAHRRAAFEAVDFLMDYLKTQALFWKQEICETTSNWIEPGAQDYRDAARWTAKGK